MHSLDNSGQLTGNTSSVVGADESFAYDANGNRIGSGLVTDPHNRLKSDADWNCLYDKEGNRTRKTAKVGGASTVYTWDHRNRLTKVEDFTSGGVIDNHWSYKFDARISLSSVTLRITSKETRRWEFSTTTSIKGINLP